MTVSDVMRYLERIAPPELSAEWDNTGLLIGSPDDPVQRLMTCLTITPEVVAEAIADQVQLIVSHHPVLFRGTKNLSTHNAEGRLLLPLLRAGIAVYSPHTSWDDAPGGINDQLAQCLGLTDVKPLIPGSAKPAYKLVVFVPENDLSRVSEAIFQAGGGLIGQYSECSFRVAGTGTFLGNEHSNPTVGQPGVREFAPEWRLEVLVPEKCLDTAIQAMRKAHSYEEPAFDIYPLRGVRSAGSGRVGNLPRELTLQAAATLLRDKLSAHSVQIVGSPETVITRVAILCGSGGKYHTEALKAQADCFLTGEATFHDCLAAKAAGLNLILPGHYASERPAMEKLANLLGQAFPAITFWPSRRESDVLATIL